jgi:multimeric flavodoxin WrbA
LEGWGVPDAADLRALGLGARRRHRHADALVLDLEALKLMIDRLVCADGGSPDPTSTHGKDPAKAKALELQGWGYPKHLDKRACGLVVHGDVARIEGSRPALSDWLDWMGLIDAGDQARLDRCIGHFEPYATSHDTLDKDEAMQEETRSLARAVARVTHALRKGELKAALADLPRPRPK